MLAAYNFWSFFWDVLLLVAWIIWFWLLITVFADLFRRHGAKADLAVRVSPRNAGQRGVPPSDHEQHQGREHKIYRLPPDECEVDEAASSDAPVGLQEEAQRTP